MRGVERYGMWTERNLLDLQQRAVLVQIQRTRGNICHNYIMAKIITIFINMIIIIIIIIINEQFWSRYKGLEVKYAIITFMAKIITIFMIIIILIIIIIINNEQFWYRYKGLEVKYAIITSWQKSSPFSSP